MTEHSVETRKTIESTNTNAEIEKIKKWFKTEYRDRLDKIQRYKYLGLPIMDSRFSLEMEAYDKENKLRELLGQEKLPEPRFTTII